MSNIENNALFKLSYGLFVVSANVDGKDNGCIVNTVIQLTDSPKRISVAVNKANLTHDMILQSGKFNVSVISESAKFSLFENFGFKSGRDAEKFTAISCNRSENGLYYVTEGVNAFISGNVINTVDCGTHTLFIADVTEAQVLTDEKSATYAYYFENIKPKPSESKTKKYVCTICGYEYEGEELPEDFVCPLCKHGAEYFELKG